MSDPMVRVGIVTTVLPRSGGPSGARPIAYFRRMALRAAELGAELSVFSPEDVNWAARRVHAWVPADLDRPEGPWRCVWRPLPQALYENVFVHLAVRGYTNGLRAQARRHGIPLFNPVLPNKWQLYRWLRHTDLARYLPETHRLTAPTQAIAYIHEWRSAYVKPIGGYGGTGVTRVEASRDGRFRVSADRLRQGGAMRRWMTERALATWLTTHARTPHLVQRGLPLMTLAGRKVDFRVVVCRGLGGRWRTVGVIPKRAARDGVVTNLVAGGERLDLARCRALAAREGKVIPVADLEECALAIAKKISARRPTTGLLGFDLGVDDAGRVWLIEMNPKPARSLLDAEMKRMAARLNAEFLVHLARRGRV
ncbi:YheC/YheD family protein [Alicyclobacillus macrosporangiidus]|uniref:YheC/YheD family endospore coat-associated protein n=1 Tax=Alicyclobacillus macrosporangiidus TaxID=392015 RepID=UPI0006920B71|nr:YheC/YheD family protein [Alicyclobacillus macrosporangiidus]